MCLAQTLQNRNLNTFTLINVYLHEKILSKVIAKLIYLNILKCIGNTTELLLKIRILYFKSSIIIKDEIKRVNI